MSAHSAKTVFVAMSGGVDSSVAALLLKDRGYRVVGVFMRCYNVDGCAERDAEDARRAAEHLAIPFYAWDFEKAYKQRVVEYMIEGYRRGETPNPDVMCNREIKFGLFLKKALRMGADYIATGHYVRLKKMPLGLFAAKDANKDQSYFLWTLTRNDLKHCVFPIGDFLKSDVRAIARRAGLPTAGKKDSQGICFLGKISAADFLKRYIPEKRGAVLTTAGEKIGEHRGAYFYTIGQRHGLHLSSKNRELGVRGNVATAPHYVAAKDVRTNTIIVAEGEDRKALCKKEAMLTDVNLIRPGALRAFPARVLARVRYRQPLAQAALTRGAKRGAFTLAFDEPQRFVAPGQSAVFYGKNGEMLGGGMIEK